MTGECNGKLRRHPSPSLAFDPSLWLSDNYAAAPVATERFQKALPTWNPSNSRAKSWATGGATCGSVQFPNKTRAPIQTHEIPSLSPPKKNDTRDNGILMGPGCLSKRVSAPSISCSAHTLPMNAQWTPAHTGVNPRVMVHCWEEPQNIKTAQSVWRFLWRDRFDRSHGARQCESPRRQ